MAVQTDHKVYYYETSDGTKLPFLYDQGELWTGKRVMAQLLRTTAKSLTMEALRLSEHSNEKNIFRWIVISSDAFPESGERTKQVTIGNADTVLALLYRKSEEEALLFHKWLIKVTKKEGGTYPARLDPEITGRGRLFIMYGDMQDSIYNPEIYFRNTYQDAWFADPYVRKMIKSIDRAEVLDNGLINSPVLGKIPPTELSGGVKTLILLYKDPNHIYNVSTCGDNCARWILDLAKKRNLTINLHHIMDFGDRNFDALILNNGQYVKNMAELVQYAGYFV